MSLGIDFLTNLCYTGVTMEKLKQKTNQITLATLAVGAVVVPIQSPMSEASTNLQTDTSHAKIQSEHHPHHTDHGVWQNHFVDPRSIRAVGHDTGKESEKNDLQDPWSMYNARAV